MTIDIQAAANPRDTRGGSLTVSALSKSFLGVRALAEVSFRVHEGELVGLIGPNGSGKTTLIDCISGFVRPEAGRVIFNSHDILGWSPHRIARKGLIRTFQMARAFPTLTVAQNLLVSALHRSKRRALWPARLHVYELIEKFGLSHVAQTRAAELSYGQRKLVELAAGLVAQPRLLLLDEPIAAINPTLALTIMGEIRELHTSGTSILLVEHNIEAVTRLAQRLVVLDHGAKIADGPPDTVIKSQTVQEAYFGR
jgi:ABC-type branched-subunit amino acid transport system ATPase component